MAEKMMDIKEFARAAHYSERLIRQYCIDGKIEGARKLADNARKWLIPASALQKLEPLTNTLIPDAKPHDKRILQEQGSSGQPMNLHEKPYEETPHKRKMRELAPELAAELSLPVDFQKFIEDLTPGIGIIGQGFFVRITEAGNIEPVLVSEDEELQAPQFKRHLYEALLSHLRTGGFSEIEGNIVEWKRKSGEFLIQSHKLFKMIMKDVGDRYGLAVSFDSLEQKGFTPDFFKILQQTVIFGVKPESYLYRLKASDLYCGAYKIRTGSPGEDQESYKKTHIELREKYLNDDLAKQVGIQLRTVRQTEKAVGKRLAVFADMERLPGRCELC